MNGPGRFAPIEAEQDVFDRQLDSLLPEHEGEFVVFRDGRAVAFYPTYAAAYRAALDAFGPDQVFLVSEVKKRGPETVSLSWLAGVMFGSP